MKPRSPTETGSRPAGSASVREHNLAMIVAHVFGRVPSPSRADLAAATGMTRATVSRLVQELVDARILCELAPEEDGQRGRPGTPLAPARRTVAGIGLEANVSYLAGRAIDLTGATLGEFRVQGNFSKPPAADVLGQLGQLATALQSSLASAGIPIVAARLALPGLVSHDPVRLEVAPNLGWRDLDPIGLLGAGWAATGVPTLAHNDAKLQSIAAARHSPGRLVEQPTFLYLAGDIGIGGALVTDGRIDLGWHGWAGEIGHTCVDPAGPPCHCGASGCLETYAGQTAIRAAAGLAPSAGIESLLAQLKANQPQARAALFTASTALGIAIANAANLLDIPRVVLGTSLGRLLPWLEPALSSELSSRLLLAANRSLEVVSGPELDSPACTGGAFAALETLISDPGPAIDTLNGRVGST